MLTLTPGSACDVCAEEYGPQCHPHSIPCGHVLCASCCSTIVEKTPSRLPPVCPFCRENFTQDSIRIIRMDFNSSSGWNTPRRMPVAHVETSQTDFAALWARKMERSSSGARSDARRLEDKVAKVAAKKCSVEEVSSLFKELEEWVNTDGTEQTSLFLSFLLLRCILLNHQAHSEASRNIKAVEANLKAKIDDLQLTNEKIETELRKQRQQYTNKAQEYQTVCVELNRLKASLGVSVDTRQSATSPTPPSTSPTPYTTASSQSSPLSRLHSQHHRSASMSSRPTTPATPSPSRTYTPAPPLPRMHTPGPPLSRTQTPMSRPFTPAPLHSLRSMTQTPSPMRQMTTPAPPPIPTKPRRLSTPSPPKMTRSSSEEKAELHQIWMPPGADQQKMRPPSRSATRTPYTTASSRFAPSLAR